MDFDVNKKSRGGENEDEREETREKEYDLPGLAVVRTVSALVLLGTKHSATAGAYLFMICQSLVTVPGTPTE
jgi:hypothetical protein